MFKLFNKKNTPILAPVNGTLQTLKQLNDGVFSSGMMGSGFAVYPLGNVVTAPLAGKVVAVFPTKHAITMKDENNREILLHLGIDTVELGGKPFEVLVEAGQKIDAGTKLVKMDVEGIKQAQKNPSIIVLFTNLQNEAVNLNDVTAVEQNESVAQIVKS